MSSAAHLPNAVEVVAVLGGPVEVGVGDPDRARHQRLERFLDRRQAGDRQGAHGGAVVGDVARQHLVAAGLAGGPEVLAGQLPRRLHGLAAAGREEHPVERPGRQRRQPLRQLDGVRVGVAPQREVGQLAGLAGGGLGQLPAAVPGLDHEQARQPVQVAPPPAVPHPRALAPDDDRHVVLGVGAHAGEVHPQVAPGRVLQVLVVSGHAGGAGRDRRQRGVGGRWRVGFGHRVPHW